MAAALSPEDTARFQALQTKALAGTITLAEQMEAVTILRQNRLSAQIGSTKARSAKAEAARPIDTDALLANLRSLGAKLTAGPVEGGAA